LRVWKKKLDESPVKEINNFTPVEGLAITDGLNTWYIKGSKRFKVFSDRAVNSWNFPVILNVNPNVLDGIEDCGVIGFRDGSLIKDIVSGKIYLVSGSKVRLITSPDTLDVLGRDKVIEVSSDEIKIHIEGEPLNDFKDH
jgi:hypothetical protein